MKSLLLFLAGVLVGANLVYFVVARGHRDTAPASVVARGVNRPNRPMAMALTTPTSPPSVTPATSIPVSRPRVDCNDRGTSTSEAAGASSLSSAPWLCPAPDSSRAMDARTGGSPTA